MIKNNLLYSYDEGDGKISPLPASPYLVPAILAYCLLWLGSLTSRYIRGNTGPENLTNTRGLEYQTWKIYRDRYIFLVDKKAKEGLTIQEIRELTKIQYPPWAGPGEVWTYK